MHFAVCVLLANDVNEVMDLAAELWQVWEMWGGGMIASRGGVAEVSTLRSTPAPLQQSMAAELGCDGGRIRCLLVGGKDEGGDGGGRNGELES